MKYRRRAARDPSVDKAPSRATGVMVNVGMSRRLAAFSGANETGPPTGFCRGKRFHGGLVREFDNGDRVVKEDATPIVEVRRTRQAPFHD